MAFYKNYLFKVESELSVQSMMKIFSKTAIIKLFPIQSEISVLPAGCSRRKRRIRHERKSSFILE